MVTSSMSNSSTYQIAVQSPMDMDDINAASPLQATLVKKDTVFTLFAVCTDQSGLMGLLRYLHNRGVVLLSVTCVMKE